MKVIYNNYIQYYIQKNADLEVQTAEIVPGVNQQLFKPL